jgi:hypothetical protein
MLVAAGLRFFGLPPEGIASLPSEPTKVTTQVPPILQLVLQISWKLLKIPQLVLQLVLKLLKILGNLQQQRSWGIFIPP